MKSKYEVSSNIEEQLEVVDILIKYERYDMALESLMNIREDYPEIEEVYFKASEVYEKKGLIQKAIEEMRKLEHINDNSGEVKFKLATLYQQDNQLDKTFRYLALAMNSGYDSEEIFYYKGLVYECDKKFEEAIMLYNKAMIKNSLYMEPKYRMYYLYLSMDRKIEAENILNKMIEENPDEYAGYALKTLFKINEKEYDDADKVLRLARDRFGKLEYLDLDYIRYYIEIKKYDDAMKIIGSIKRDNQYYSLFMVLKAKILNIQGKIASAINILEDKDIFDAKNQELVYMLTFLRYRNDEFESLINLLEKVKEMDLSTDYGRISEILKGYAYVNLNNEKRAIEVFENLNKVLRVQNISNPYDISSKLYRMITLIELEEFDKLYILKDGVDKLDKIKYENIITQINKLKELKESRKDENRISEQKEILTTIFK